MQEYDATKKDQHVSTAGFLHTNAYFYFTVLKTFGFLYIYFNCIIKYNALPVKAKSLEIVHIFTQTPEGLLAQENKSVK